MSSTGIASRLAAYKRPALHFSGGKDSLACLYLLREHLDKITVYWLNTGDGCPETQAVVDDVRKWVPSFVEIQSDVAAWRLEHGFPSDLVPAKAHRIGVMYGMNGFGLTNRFDCCAANIMAPVHARMLADGVDLVIRGTKTADTGRVPANGTGGDYDVWLPIDGWSHEDVFAYLRDVGAPVNPIYEHFKGISAPECMGCTAWWDDGKAAYLRKRHPEMLDQYQENLRAIRISIASHLSDLDKELED
jgi:phosphoadenosine phosphosulfate reductase